MSYFTKLAVRIRQVSELRRLFAARLQAVSSSAGVGGAATASASVSGRRYGAVEAIRIFTRDAINRGRQATAQEFRAFSDYLAGASRWNAAGRWNTAVPEWSRLHLRAQELRTLARNTFGCGNTSAELRGRYMMSLVQRQKVGLLSCLGLIGRDSHIVLQTSAALISPQPAFVSPLELENQSLRVRLQDAQNKLSALESTVDCVVCMEKPRSVTYGCGHRIVCSICDEYISRPGNCNRCPFCRANINTRLHHFV